MNSSPDGPPVARYVGRFAPSPTGPLHFGSLVTALASFLDARAHGGHWLVRIEDLDPPRESPRAPAQIMSQLRAHGLHWDGNIAFQSDRLSAYDQALTHLRHQRLCFPCKCARNSFRGIYPGTCRSRRYEDTNLPYAERVFASGPHIMFKDLVLGKQTTDLKNEIGDFVIRRKDGLTAYQLAVIVDDGYQGITHVIRGSDLLSSTARQIHLARLLNIAIPVYAHIPVVLGPDGDKLSKQTHAPPVEEASALPTLRLALKVLGQSASQRTTISGLLADAIQRWDLTRVPLISFQT